MTADRNTPGDTPCAIQSKCWLALPVIRGRRIADAVTKIDRANEQANGVEPPSSAFASRNHRSPGSSKTDATQNWTSAEAEPELATAGDGVTTPYQPEPRPRNLEQHHRIGTATERLCNGNQPIAISATTHR
jgi:hypothetical protein